MAILAIGRHLAEAEVPEERLIFREQSHLVEHPTYITSEGDDVLPEMQ